MSQDILMRLSATDMPYSQQEANSLRQIGKLTILMCEHFLKHNTCSQISNSRKSKRREFSMYFGLYVGKGDFSCFSPFTFSIILASCNLTVWFSQSPSLIIQNSCHCKRIEAGLNSP
jgi:hypothetical protein